MKNQKPKQSITLWHPLPESQQEMLSGGSPRINRGGGSGGSGGSGDSGVSGSGPSAASCLN